MTSEMTPTLMYTHTSLKACDLCPPSDPKIQLMLDPVGVGAYCSQIPRPQRWLVRS